jgi:branched-chain amino acid transport system permease protein
LIALQYILDAINIGGLYAMMALGIGLIFGIMRLINFAHGEMVMAGGYAIGLLATLPTPLVIVLSLVFIIALALLIEQSAFRPLRGQDPATLLVASFAVSYFLQNLTVMIFGARPLPFTFAPGLADTIEVTGLRLPLLQFVSLGLMIIALAGVATLLKRTALGIQLRAAAEDVVTARLSGVKVNRVIAFAFVMSAVLAWIVSLIYSAQIGQLSPAMGVRPLIIGFVATILGGLGSLFGAALGGFVVGAISVLLDAILPAYLRPFREAFLFGLVFVILVVRPEGLLRVRALQERV